MAKEEQKKHEASAATVSPLPPLGKASIEKKLTTKIVMGKKINGGDVEKGPVQLYSIIGVCTGYKTGESQYGGWVGFTGIFESTRFADGARFTAPVAFIPEPASSMMLSGIDRALKAGGENADVSLRFAFIIGVKPSDKAAGFEYTVEPVMQASQNDALAELRSLVAPRLPALTQT